MMMVFPMLSDLRVWQHFYWLLAGSFERFAELSEIKGQTKIPRARLMIEELLANNTQLLELLNKCFAIAESENQQGIANFIAERIDAQQKHGWMLRSFLKDERA